METKERLELINKKIEELEAVLSTLKQIRDNPDIGERAVIEKSGIDYRVFRRIVYDANWMEKKSWYSPTEEDIDGVFKRATPTMSWQETLWCSAYGLRCTDIICAPVDVVDTIDALLEKINAEDMRIGKVLSCRYKYSMMLEDVAKIMGVTRERVRQLEIKGLRRLRENGHWMWYGKYRCVNAYYIEKQLERDIEIRVRSEIIKELSGRTLELKDLIRAGIESISRQQTNSENPVDKLTRYTPLENCNLSSRTYCSLKRFGIKLLGDILNYSEYEIRQIRNIGRKSYEEIMSKLKEAGLIETETEE